MSDSHIKINSQTKQSHNYANLKNKPDQLQAMGRL